MDLDDFFKTGISRPSKKVYGSKPWTKTQKCITIFVSMNMSDLADMFVDSHLRNK